MHYVNGTLNYGLVMTPTSQLDLANFCDVDLGGCPDDRKSTSMYCVFFGDNLIS